MNQANTAFHRIRLGTANAYLIQRGQSCLLIDAGQVNNEKRFVRFLERRRISPHQVQLIVVTHAHFDHVGSLKSIKELCGCPVAVHQKEAPLVRKGAVVFPPGTNLFGRAISCLGKKMGAKLLRFPPVEPDMEVSQEVSLEKFGHKGRIIPTSGHTEGSLSVLLPTGEAFVGDLAANYLPFGLGPIFPPFAENVEQLLKSWQILLAAGATTICPGHGAPFSAELLKGKKGSKSIDNVGDYSDSTP